jgi:threonine dehydratase
MAEISTTMPLTAPSVHKAYEKIKQHVHTTPLLTNKTLDRISSTPISQRASSSSSPTTGQGSGTASDSKTETVDPKFNLYFKCENMQRIGAFKARGAFHAMIHLVEEMGIEEVRRRGVVTHSSGKWW